MPIMINWSTNNLFNIALSKTNIQGVMCLNKVKRTSIDKFIISLFIAVLASNLAGAQVPTRFREIPEDVEITENLTYAKNGDSTLQLDLYRPLGTEKLPAIVILAEGGWIHPGKDFNGPLAARIAKSGFVVVSTEYRAASEAILPAAVHDTKAAIRWLRANAELFNIDPDAIGAIGSSWGAYLAVYTALTNDLPELEGNGGSEGFSSSVSAVVGLSALIDLEKLGPRLDRLLGETIESNPSIWKFYSPITHVHSDSPPMLLIASRTDDTVPFDQSIEMEQAYENAGREIELILLPDNGGHSFWYFDESYEMVIERATHFFHDHLGM